jgi:hypothetical protein
MAFIKAKLEVIFARMQTLHSQWFVAIQMPKVIYYFHIFPVRIAACSEQQS